MAAINERLNQPAISNQTTFLVKGGVLKISDFGPLKSRLRSHPQIAFKDSVIPIWPQRRCDMRRYVHSYLSRWDVFYQLAHYDPRFDVKRQTNKMDGCPHVPTGAEARPNTIRN
jgi:hypothetical protein